MRRTRIHGVSLTFTMVAATLSIMVIFAVVRLMQSSARQVAYLEIMGDVYSLTESGLSVAVNDLIKDPKACESGAHFRVDTPVTGGKYRIDCARRVIPVQRQPTLCYYITVMATRTVSGRDYSQRLHSYVEISNVTDYLYAVNGPLQIGYQTQAPRAKIYARRLMFESNLNRSNSFYKAEFSELLVPPLNTMPGNGPCTTGDDCTQWSKTTAWPSAQDNGRNIVLSTPTTESPVKLPGALRFPIITQSDANTYAQLAGKHTRVSNFNTIDWTDIYPPGYQGTIPAGDKYAAMGFHENDNKQHVYYSSDDIHIGIPGGSTVTIHGQIIFFTTNSIFIDGNILVANDNLFPGDGLSSSSTAHQAVFIAGAGKDINITDKFCNESVTTPYPAQTLTLQAFVFATSGYLNPAPTKATQFPLPCNSSLLAMNFKGSIVVGNVGDLATMFALGLPLRSPRVYEYMTSLQDHPPPYVPVFTITYNEFQEIVGTPAIY